MSDDAGNLVDRTLRRLARAWRGLARGDRREGAFAAPAPDLPDQDLARGARANRGMPVAARRRGVGAPSRRRAG